MTTAPAPMKACAPIVNPHTTTTPAPNVAPTCTRVASNSSPLRFDRRTRSQVVGEHDCRAKKHAVLDSHTVELQDAILDRDAVTDRDTAFPLSVVTDIAVMPDFGAGKNMPERPNPGSSADVVAPAKSVWVGKVPGSIPLNP